MSSEFLRQLGPLVLDHRFRRMVETLVQTAEDIYERLGIPFRARWASTYLLLETDAPIGITAIADRIGLTHPAAIGLTNDMMAAGLVEEVADAADQRRRMLRLSAAGRRLGPRLHAIWDALAAAQRARFKTAGCDIVAVLNNLEDGIRKKSIVDDVLRRLQQAAMLCVALVGICLTSARPVFAQTDTIAPGKRIDVGGYSLHLQCTGTGSPTVVLIHGFNDYSFVWGLVQPEVSKFTRVCAYDRASQAWSDPGPAPRGLQRITDELHRLLQTAAVPGPYVLVGHSWGGMIPRIFAHDHPGATAGIVFVDATHEDNYLGIADTTVQPRLVPDSVWRRIWRPAPRAPNAPPASFQPRAVTTVYAPFDRLPAAAQAWFKWARSRPVFYQNGDWEDIRDDMRLVHERSAQRNPLGNKPVIVISGGLREDVTSDGVSAEQRRAQFEKGQRQLASLSTNSRHIWAQSSGHHIHLEEPDLVVEAIRQVVMSARSGQLLRE